MPTYTNDDTLRQLLILLCKRPWKEELWGLVADRLEDLEAPEILKNRFKPPRLRLYCVMWQNWLGYLSRRQIAKRKKEFRAQTVAMCGILEPQDEVPEIPF